MKVNINYIIAEEYLAKLPNDLKVKLCKKMLAGVEVNKVDRKKRVREFIAYLDKK